MFHFRIIAAASVALGLLAGCSTAELQKSALPAALNVVSVVVDAGSLDGIEGRSIARSNAQITADIEGAVRRAFAAKSQPNGTPVQVTIDVQEVKLANAVDRVAAQASTIHADLTVVSEAGATVVPTQRIVGTSEGVRLAGTFGALTTPGVDKDYSDTVAGFAATLQTLLFPEQ